VFSMGLTDNKVSLYVLAGVATSLSFMEDFVKELERRYQHAGYEIQTHLLFPYGDWGRNVVKQVIEIGFDLMPRFVKTHGYPRGQVVANHIKKTHQSGRIVIIGHSSGGVTGVHAASYLDRAQFPEVFVVQIGSPKCHVPSQARIGTLFVYAVNEMGKSTDPITWLGSWGGWEQKGAFARWNRKLKAPANIIAVSLIGGHADYFRNSFPFIDTNGRSNLEKTADALCFQLIL
jgi:hypothetical protein